MSDQVALAMIGAFATVTTALLGFIAKEISGLRHDIKVKHEDHEIRITRLEKNA